MNYRKLIREALFQGLCEAEGLNSAPGEPPTPDAPEPTGESAADTAHKLGLTYAGGTVWKDKSGKTVAQTVDGKLVKLDEPQDDPAAQTKAATAKNLASRSTATAADDDPYGTPAPLANKTGRTSRYKLAQFAGRIEPPTTPDGRPVEVVVKGQPGIVDLYKDDKAHVTYDSGDGEWVSRDQLKKKHPSPEVDVPEPKTKPTQEVTDLNENYVTRRATKAGLVHIGWGLYAHPTDLKKPLAESVNGKLRPIKD